MPQNCLTTGKSAGVFIHQISSPIRVPWGISSLVNSFCLAFGVGQAPLAENEGTVQ